MRTSRVRTACCVVLVTGLLAASGPTAAASSNEVTSDSSLTRYAADTWASLAAMVDPATGVPADNIGGDLSSESRSEMTSPTNIGMYLWAVVTARDIGLISSHAANTRVKRALSTVCELDRHEPSGQFYNWYDPHTGEVLHEWPDSGDPIYPFLSSVDNGWLASALLVVEEAVPSASRQAKALAESMDFAFYYDPEARGPDVPAGLIRGGFWPEPPADGTCTVEDNHPGDGPNVFYTCHHYGTLGETRIASYVGIALGQIPPEHYFAIWRTFPDSCDYEWQEQEPVGRWETHLGVPVFEGTYEYRGSRLVPNWGGSMFEALMVPLVVPEESWAPRSWGRNHPVFVQAQITHGLREAKYGYWGFSPSNDPHGGYREYGVDPIGLAADGYTSDAERTTVDYGFPSCGRDPGPDPVEYGDGVVTPHASFLALRHAPRAALSNLAKLRSDFDAYGPGGFYDSVAVRSGAVSKRYLALDQGMVFAALGNALTGDNLRRYFARGPGGDVLPHVLAVETWDAHS